MKQFKKLIASGLCLTLVGTMLAGCSSKQETPAPTTPAPSTPAPTAPAPEPAGLSGDLNLGGSTSVEAVVTAAIDEFIAQNPDVTGKYDGTGSSTGMNNAIDGTYNVGFASRDVKDSELEAGLTAMSFALDGIALAVNPANSVKDITMEQLLAVYTGEITNWSELGGEDADIIVVSREDGSGTRSAFEEIIGLEALSNNATIKDANGTVATYIAQEPNALGYISFVTLEANKDSVNSIKVDGADPTVEAIKDGSYKVARSFNLAYMEENITDAEKAFVEFLLSDEGQDIAVDKGAIAIN